MPNIKNIDTLGNAASINISLIMVSNHLIYMYHRRTSFPI